MRQLALNAEKLGFRERIDELTGQETLRCYQCGTCSSSCQFADEMEFMPNQIMHLIQLGDETIIHSNAPWVCVSCLSCSARCPKELKIAETMEALRFLYQQTKRDFLDISKIPPEEFDEIPQIAWVAAFRKFTG